MTHDDVVWLLALVIFAAVLDCIVGTVSEERKGRKK